MQKLLIATTNPAKLKEIRMYLEDLSFEFVSLTDCGITQEVEEDGKTFEENSQKKAIYYAKVSGLPTISDDGGLQIDALDGAPGVHSKRWVASSKEEDIFAKMSQLARDLPSDNRNATFTAVLTLALPGGQFWSVEGSTYLCIANKPSEKYVKGFPYRSFLIVPELNKYYQESELTQNESREYNHRYKAIQLLKPIIIKTLKIKVD